MTAPYEVGTAINLSIGSSSFGGMFVSSDGHYLFVADDTNERIWRYTLSTAWDVSTAGSATFLYTYASSPPFRDVSGVWLSSNGYVMIGLDGYNDTLQSWSLSTAYSLATASVVTTEVDAVGGVSDSALSMCMSYDGTRLYVGTLFGRVVQHNLGTPWDISTASIASTQSLSPINYITGLSISQDGSKLYVLSDGYRTVYTVGLATPFNISSYQTPVADIALNSYGFSPYVGAYVPFSDDYLYILGVDGSYARVQQFLGTVDTVSEGFWINLSNLEEVQD